MHIHAGKLVVWLAAIAYCMFLGRSDSYMKYR